MSIENPAEAVEDKRIIRLEFEGLVDQLACFGELDVALSKGVAERVVGLRAVRAQLDQFAQAAFQNVHLAELFGEQRGLVKQIGLFRVFR